MRNKQMTRSERYTNYFETFNAKKRTRTEVDQELLYLQGICIETMEAYEKIEIANTKEKTDER